MPIQRCSIRGKRGWRFGKSGKCYLGTGARARARTQERAIRASGFTGNQRKAARKEKLRTQIIPSNPLKADPTRTTTLRRIFQTDFRKRFNFLKGLILRLIVEEDAFGISELTIDPLTGDFRRERTTEQRPNTTDGGANLGNQNIGNYSHATRGSNGDPCLNNRQTNEGGGVANHSNDKTGRTSRDEPSQDGADATSKIQNSQPSTTLNRDTSRDSKSSSIPTLNTRWRFLTQPQQLQAFQVWLAAQIQEGILGGVTQQTIDDAYWQKYVQEGYRKGAGRAFNDVRKPALASGKEQLSFFQGTKDEFLRQSFAHPIAVEKVKLLTGRVFTDLKGVTEAMATRMTRELADGLVQGKGPREVARSLNKAIDSIGKNRALMIARTETIRAHAEGQLDALENLGVTEVGVQVEWSTAGDDRVCPLCQPLEGVVMKIKEAKGTLPRHPSCRCSFIPAGVGESTQGQKRSKKEIQESFDRSIKAEAPKRSLAKQKKRTPWAGADKTIAKKRPEPLV